MKKTNIFDSGAPFFVGANYWASYGGTFMWRNWDAKQVEKDFKILHQNGAQVLRVFPLWSDFQRLTDHLMIRGIHREFRYGEEPLADTSFGKAAIDPEMMDHFHEFCRLAEKYELKLIVGLLTGWMSGRLYVPPALEHLNLLNDARAIQWEIRFVRCFVREMKEESAIAAWDWGNECNALAPHSDEEMWVWGNQMTLAIKAEDDSRPVVSGLTGSMIGPVRDMGEVCDILTTHPYPLFTPHCSIDYIDSFRNAFHAAAQTCWSRDIGKKPAFVEEIGSFGPTVTSDHTTDAFLSNSLWNSYAHNCHGLLWWCAHDQTELPQTPYDWTSMERELGMVRADGTPKEFLKTMGKFGTFAKKNPLAQYRTDAVVLPSTEGDHWGIGYMTFLLAKQAGFDVQFYDGIGSIPKSNLYILPSVSGTRIFPKHQYLEILRRVRAGATLYLSSGYSGLQPFDGFGIEIESVAKADKPGRVIAPEYGIDLTIPREYSIRTGVCTGKVLARNEEGRPAFTVSDYGKGKLIFLTVPLESSLMDLPRAFEENSPDYAAVYRKIMEISGIKREVSCKTSLVTLTEHLDGKMLKVVAVNNTGTEKNTEFDWNSRWELVKVVNGVNKGFSVKISPHSGVILCFRKK